MRDMMRQFMEKGHLDGLESQGRRATGDAWNVEIISCFAKNAKNAKPARTCPAREPAFPYIQYLLAYHDPSGSESSPAALGSRSKTPGRARAGVNLK